METPQPSPQNLGVMTSNPPGLTSMVSSILCCFSIRSSAQGRLAVPWTQTSMVQYWNGNKLRQSLTYFFPISFYEYCKHLKPSSLSVKTLVRMGSNVPSKLCTCVCVHTGHEMSAHKKTWNAHICSLQNCFCTYFMHIIPNSD